MPASLFPTPTASGSSVPNWTLVTSSAPTGVATVTFSGLSGYSKYRILTANLTNSSAISPNPYLTINGDSGANYSRISFVNGATVSSNLQGNNIPLANSVSGTASASVFYADIEHALLACPKLINFAGVQYAFTGALSGTAWYQTTSTVTSLSVTDSSNFASGSIYLLGAN